MDRLYKTRSQILVCLFIDENILEASDIPYYFSVSLFFIIELHNI
jgi:hypothetical protein